MTICLVRRPMEQVNIEYRQWLDELRTGSAGELQEIEWDASHCGGRDLIGEIKAMRPDVIVTENLAGFEQSTLTDSVAYNLLSVKQIHVINDRAAIGAYESDLAKPLSLAMFFYACDEACIERLKLLNNEILFVDLLGERSLAQLIEDTK